MVKMAYFGTEPNQIEGRFVLFDIQPHTDEEGNAAGFRALAVEVQNPEFYTPAEMIRVAQNTYKEHMLGRVIVTTASGKRFYGDPTSRIDLNDAITIGTRKGLTETPWKTADGWMTVTLEELAEALELALSAKGSLVGLTNA